MDDMDCLWNHVVSTNEIRTVGTSLGYTNNPDRHNPQPINTARMEDRYRHLL
jgi:hypothetical protein